MGSELQLDKKVTRLIEKGVQIPNPFSVEIGSDVEIERIAGNGVVLYPGTRIHGKKTLIGSGSKIGSETPATLIDCLTGCNVELRGGFFKDSLFLDRVSIGSGAQIREGCILEEESGGNHTIGLKQTILFPYVTLGSLINFCDCFMAGGTDRKNHSEIGSSFIHFNYTPNQDKATPSLIGDVPRGVMLDQSPIFLGGQGGIVGPIRIGYGTVTAAGSVIRQDCPEGGKILVEKTSSGGNKSFKPGYYPDIKKRVINNVYFLANLLALKEWYSQIRHRFLEMREFGEPLCQAGLELIRAAIEERLKRFHDLSEKMRYSVSIQEREAQVPETALLQKREFIEKWPEIEVCFRDGSEEQIGLEDRDSFIREIWEKMEFVEGDYLNTIRKLNPEIKAHGTAWLQAIVDHVIRRVQNVVPSFDI